MLWVLINRPYSKILQKYPLYAFKGVGRQGKSHYEPKQSGLKI